MTPEERAAELDPRLSYSSSHADRREMIAAAIRDAENDALERAAKTAEESVQNETELEKLSSGTSAATRSYRYAAKRALIIAVNIRGIKS